MDRRSQSIPDWPGQIHIDSDERLVLAGSSRLPQRMPGSILCPPRWVDLLNESGFQAAHWSSLGPVDAPDTAFMGYAKLNGYVVLTHDLDFGAILAATQGDKPSVVQLRAKDISPAAIGAQVIAALQQMRAGLEVGALLTVDISRTRLRVLPLRH